MTDQLIRLLLLIVIGGLIGYITNKVAIKMLFRPVNPINFGLFKLQGVFPKRKDQMAISLAHTIESELLSKDTIMDSLLPPDKMEEMKTLAKDILIKKITEMIPPMFRMFMGNNPEEMVRKLVLKEGDKILDEVIETIKTKSLDNLDIEALVKQRIDELDFVEFERIIFGLMNRELRFVEIIGLFLGALIGLLQFFVTLVF
jgi:uncharacterized membrane protein YheB (UPF0754 family)